MSETSDHCLECVVCESELSDVIVISCDSCGEWSHCTCVGLTEGDVEFIRDWYCNKCESKGKISKWRRFQASAEKRVEKEKHYYDVELIEKVREVENKREFYIKWKGYTKKTWEPEEHLDGSIDLLQKFLRQKGLPISRIRGLLGSDNTEDCNRMNWVSMDKLLENFHSAKRRTRLTHPDIEIGEWTKFGNHDGLYFLPHGFHCYTMLHLHKRNITFIADGINLLKEDPKIFRKLKDILKVRLLVCKFSQQTKVDFCASSSILIGLEFLRAYKNNLFPSKITAPKTWIQIVTNILHKYKSKSLKLPKLRDRRFSLSCHRCNKTFKSTQRRAFSQHSRLCKA